MLDIDGHPVNEVEDVQKIMERAAAEKASAVVFRVKRGIRTFFVELQATWE